MPVFNKMMYEGTEYCLGITKIFTLTDLTSSSNLAIATEAYQWYLNGGEPIIDYNGRRHHLNRMSPNAINFSATYVSNSIATPNDTYLYNYTLKFAISSGSIIAIGEFKVNIGLVDSLPATPSNNTLYFI